MWFWVVLLASGAALGCSKTNNVDLSTAQQDNVGEPCERPEDCVGGAVCAFGYCRASCATDVECPADAICLGSPAGSGCRLAMEAACLSAGGGCPANSALMCGLDLECRRPCSGNSECLATQQCLSGGCVGGLEPGGSDAWFSCTSGKSCGGVNGAELISCNEKSPGPTSLATCESSALCEAGKAEGACAMRVCAEGATRCQESTLEVCAASGLSFEKVAGPCASPALCELTRAQAASSCVAPTCQAGESQCRGGAVLMCNSELTAFAQKLSCAAQCNPSTGTCVEVPMDAHEVSRAAYSAFLATPNKPAAVLACSANSLEPDAACLAMATAVCQGPNCDNHPQVCVDWCDADAFCRAEGKHLCGKIGGGLLPFDQFSDAGKSEWMNRCSAGGELAFPYGVALNNASCKGKIFQPNQTVEVGTLIACQSSAPGYGGIFDLSGNVEEWENSCERDASLAGAGPTDKCRIRGGSFLSEGAALSCAADTFLLRSMVSPTVGFRCCG